MKRELKRLEKIRRVKQIKRWKMKIQNDLNNYIFFEKEIAEKEDENIGIGAQVIDDMPKGQGGDCKSKTEQQALRLIHELEELRRAKKAIEKAVEEMNNDTKDYFYMRYEKEFTLVKICRELFITDRTYRRINNRIIEKVGKEMGLID